MCAQSDTNRISDYHLNLSMVCAQSDKNRISEFHLNLSDYGMCAVG